jgi:hypothetical protein
MPSNNIIQIKTNKAVDINHATNSRFLSLPTKEELRQSLSVLKTSAQRLSFW